MDSELLLEMLERMSVAATVAFILAQMSIFRRIVYRKILLKERALLSLLFGMFGILGTYAGIPIVDALANSRAIGVMAAGLIGGPSMGIAAGFIAGGHRYFLGGFTAFSCALANICEGLLAGWVYKKCSTKPVPWWIALITGMIGEIMQMLIILLTARPFELALELVDKIAIPMIIANSLGLAIFMLIIKTVIDSQQLVGAEQSHKALDIATKTLPYLRRGLNSHSAEATVKIIYAVAGYDAVAITDTEKVLAFVGAEADHHVPDRAGMTRLTKQSLATGEMQIAQNREEIGCSCQKCKLASAIIVPLKRANVIIGTLKLYYIHSNAVGQNDMTFVSGLAHLFSTQLELAEVDRQSKLAAKAKLKALYAQINPHFFFNTLNTIASLIRTKPDLARELLLKLATIFRYALQNTGRDITIADELTQVRAYLAIEKARYGDKLNVVEEFDVGVEKYIIPSLTVQPLVENAVKHGLHPKESGGRILIKINERDKSLEISIVDDGVGIDLRHRDPLQEPTENSIGLLNVHERLRGQFGLEYGLTINSTPGHGTTVVMRLPKRLKGEGEECA